MKKYKLLKDLPDHNIGDIHTEEHWTKWFKVHSFSNQINNRDWFEEISPLFFTEEGTPIYEGESSYHIYSGNFDVDEQYDIWSGSSAVSGKYFSNRNNALECLNKLKWKNKLKFKIGNKIKTNPEYCTVLRYDLLNELYIVKESKSENEDVIFFKNQDNFKLYKEPVKLEIGKWYEYKGDYMCFQGNDKDYGICDRFWIKGDWVYHRHWKLADPEKVKRLLVEKVKKDYPVGTKVNLLRCARAKDVATIEFDKYHYGTVDGEYIICDQRNKLKTGSRDFFIYNNGEWAEIVEKPIHQNPDGKFVYKSDFKKGDIVYHYNAFEYLLKFEMFNNSNIIGESYINLTSKIKSKKYRNPIKNKIRKATEQEKEWFEKCERLDKYVPIDFKENKFPTITDPDFKIGDKVKVIDEREQYCNYKEAFIALNFNKNSYDYNSTEGDYGNISNITKNPNTKGTMMVIKLLNERASQILIAKEGIVLYRFTTENGVDRFIGDPFYSVNLRTLELEYWEDDFSRVIDYKFIVDKETAVKSEKSKRFSTLEAAKNFIKKEKRKREEFHYKIGDKIWNTATKKYKGEIIDLYHDINNNLLCNTDLQTSILLEKASFITNKVGVIVYNGEGYKYICKMFNKEFDKELIKALNHFRIRGYLLSTLEEYFQSIE